MPWEFYETTTQVARKNYSCDASEIIINTGYVKEDFTPDEWELFCKAHAEDFKILKGSEYIKTKGKYDGDFSVFRARPEIDAICVKYDFYLE